MFWNKNMFKNIKICTTNLNEHKTPENKEITQVSYLTNELSEREKEEGWKLLWDGKGDDGTLVASATRYTARLEATDVLGNNGRAAPVPINVDILIIKTSRGLKIRVSSIEFTFDKWELKQPNSPILNRVAELLKRYNTYKVIIEGHTDGVGRANYNLMLSTRRARTVMRYLVHRGIDEDRMLAKGLGASVPLASNRTLSGRAINRRVEFILVRD